jgi:cytosine/adenosine deaminase-related metal-dependent hydrolase
VHNPAANFKLGSGKARIVQMLQRGVTVALGADGAASSDNQSMFQIMKLAGLEHNMNYSGQKDWIAARQTFDMVTKGGSAVLLQSGRLGVLKEGALADIVLFDLTTIENAAIHDPFMHMVYCETGVSADTVIVDGKIIIRGRKFLAADEKEIAKRIRLEVERRGKLTAGKDWRIKHKDQYNRFLSKIYDVTV